MTAASESVVGRRPPVAAGLLVFLLLYGVTVFILAWGERLPLVFTYAAAVIFVVIAGPFLVLAHEGGHYLAACVIGWRVALFSWGGYTLRLKPWHIRHGAPPFADASGAVVAIPERESRWGYIAVFAGGPGANLLIAALSSAAASAMNSEFSAFFWLQAAISLFMGIANLLPWRRGSDGSQIVSLLAERDLAPRTVMAKLAEQMIQEVRPRDWPPALMQALVRLTIWTPYPSFILTLYVWRMDRGETGAARADLERAVEANDVLVERAFFAAFVEENAGLARDFFSRGQPRPSSLRYWRAQAALAVLEQDHARAGEALRKAAIIAQEDPYATVWDRDVLEQLEHRNKS